jgi:GntR family transcriptional repressor for pyruvate dehydrogenase complex
VTDDILAEMRAAILTGQLPRGSRLPSEKELAARFGVSQSSIREVCRALEAQGLIDIRHGSGQYVSGDSMHMLTGSLHAIAQMDDVNVLDVMDLRLVLGRHSISLAVDNATDADLATLAATNDEIVASAHAGGPFTGSAEQAVRFQLALSAASHNPLLMAIEGVLARLVIHLHELVLSVREVDPRWHDWSARFEPDRRALLGALERRDREGCITAIERYLGDQTRAFRDVPELANTRLSDPGLMDRIAARLAHGTRPPAIDWG